MKRIPSIYYLGILLVSLVLAYLSWTRGPSKPGEAVPILDCEMKGGVQQLTIRVEDRKLSYSSVRSDRGREPVWWVEVFGPSSEVGGSGWTLMERFKGNQRLKDTLEEFCHWEGLRSLGALEPGKREELGLAGTQDRLEVAFEFGPPRAFLIGDLTHGSQDRYVEDENSGRGFLVEGQDIKNLLHPKSRFMERSLLGFKAKDVARVHVRRGLEEKELVHLFSEQGTDKGWADGKSSEATCEPCKNWVNSLFRLHPVGYVIPEAGATAAGPAGITARSGCAPPAASEVAAEVAFYGPDEQIGFMNIYQGAAKKADAAYYVCTGDTGAVVSVSEDQAEKLLKDLQGLFSES